MPDDPKGYVCTKGRCANDGEGTVVTPERLFTHALGHAKEDLQGAFQQALDKTAETLGGHAQKIEKATAEAIGSFGNQVAGALKELTPPHASFEEIQANSKDCPTCQVAMKQ